MNKLKNPGKQTPQNTVALLTRWGGEGMLPMGGPIALCIFWQTDYGTDLPKL